MGGGVQVVNDDAIRGLSVCGSNRNGVSGNGKKGRSRKPSNVTSKARTIFSDMDISSGTHLYRVRGVVV